MIYAIMAGLGIAFFIHSIVEGYKTDIRNAYERGKRDGQNG